MDDLAKLAYEAYQNANQTPAAFPTWDTLSDKVKARWQAVVDVLFRLDDEKSDSCEELKATELTVQQLEYFESLYRSPRTTEESLVLRGVQTELKTRSRVGR